ncbi:MAG TPA: hypothetical protein PLQ01_01940 [Methanothrix sp.]|nr:hypothetical protein [Methanothrix sp.]HOV81419.1 hypothetical protein [Methanothrix sp.]HPC90116.1 hypothetical protein [Methanothrix sp.]HQI67277.1 hypothetical protein [Methanothrix sp.]HRS84260.1 hypothetical protein [Methanothrix sp.]
MNAKYGFTLAAVAALCLLAAPAYSLPGASGCKNAGFCPMMANLNLTPEEMGNMTLGEIKELQKEAWNSSAGVPAMNCSFGRMGSDGCRAQSNGASKNRPNMNGGNDKNQGDGHRGDYMSLLLWGGDITMDKLNDMTISQIRELKESRMQELDGKTLNEIRDMIDEKRQEMNNMTVNDLSAMKENLRQVSRIFNAVEASAQA